MQRTLMDRTWNEWAPLPLRLILGLGFVIHGWEKIADGTKGFQGMLQMTGIPGGAAGRRPGWPLGHEHEDDEGNRAAGCRREHANRHWAAVDSDQ